MSADPVSVLAAIVAEVAGPGQPFSADSYLPAHLIHDARQAIEGAQAAVPASALEAHETILRTRLAKADEMIASLRAEIDSLRRTGINLAPHHGDVPGPVPITFDPYERLTAYGRHPECDA